MEKREVGIYVHIPFCKHKCYYCDFTSFANKDNFIEEYIERLKKEVKEYELNKYEISTIYIGGGTPSYIDSKYIVDILNTIRKVRDRKHNRSKSRNCYRGKTSGLL